MNLTVALLQVESYDERKQTSFVTTTVNQCSIMYLTSEALFGEPFKNALLERERTLSYKNNTPNIYKQQEVHKVMQTM